MKHSLAVLALAASLGFPLHANALVIVDYAFDSTNSVFSLTSPAAVSIPPQGTINGQIRVNYTSDSGGNIADGPATLEVLNLAANLNVDTVLLGSPVSLDGPANAELKDPVEGTLTGDQLSFAGALGTFHAFGSLTCVGAVCSLGGFSPGVPLAFDGEGSVPLPTLTVASLHGNIVGLTFVVGGLNVVASLQFNAEETGPDIPEPALLLLAAVSLSATALSRRRT